MAKRQSSKPKRGKDKNSSPVSERTRKNLTKQLKNARARIKRLIDKYGTEYSGPKVEDFQLPIILSLIETGTHINTVYAMIRNTTAKKYERTTREAIEKSDPIVASMYGGIPVHNSQYMRLYSALAKANRNITSARNNFKGAEDIFPALLDADSILQKVTSTRRLDEVINTINKAFTKKKLVPVAVSDTGEAATMAELEFLDSFITEENRKRRIAREDVQQIFEERKFFKTNQEFALEDVNTSTWDNIEKWRRRTEYFTDAKALDKALTWKNNYFSSLNKLEATARDKGVFKKQEYEEIFNKIKQQANRLTSEDQIRAVVRFSEYIEIQSNYKETGAEIEALLTLLLDAWDSFYQTFTE